MNDNSEYGYYITISDIKNDKIVKEKNIQKFNCPLIFCLLL